MAEQLVEVNPILNLKTVISKTVISKKNSKCTHASAFEDSCSGTVIASFCAIQPVMMVRLCSQY